MFGLKTKKQGEFASHWQGTLSDYVAAIAWSPDGRCLAACSAAGEVMLISLPGFQSTLLQSETGCSVDCLAFSHDGQFLAIGGQDEQVKIWSLQSGSPELITTLENKSVWVDRLMAKADHLSTQAGWGMLRGMVIRLPSLQVLQWRRPFRCLPNFGNSSLSLLPTFLITN